MLQVISNIFTYANMIRYCILTKLSSHQYILYWLHVLIGNLSKSANLRVYINYGFQPMLPALITCQGRC